MFQQFNSKNIKCKNIFLDRYKIPYYYHTVILSTGRLKPNQLTKVNHIGTKCQKKINIKAQGTFL